MSSLTPIQEEVLQLIATGSTAVAAARRVGVHRHTIANWLKSDEFCEALETARHHKQILFWDQALALVSEAVADLRQLKQDPAASPSVRLRAITLLLKHGQMCLPDDSCGMGLPDPPESQLPEPASAPEHALAPALNQNMDQNIEIMSKNVQSVLPAALPPAAPHQNMDQNIKNMSKNVQSDLPASRPPVPCPPLSNAAPPRRPVEINPTLKNPPVPQPDPLATRLSLRYNP